MWLKIRIPFLLSRTIVLPKFQTSLGVGFMEGVEHTLLHAKLEDSKMVSQLNEWYVGIIFCNIGTPDENCQRSLKLDGNSWVLYWLDF